MKKNNRTYILNLTSKKMKELGFKYDFTLRDYIYQFPVYKSQKKEPLVICKLGIDEGTKQVFFNVYDIDGSFYTSYYNRDYGKSKVVEAIDKNIKKEFKKLGVVEKNEQ